jgi:hypothetical protein
MNYGFGQPSTDGTPEADEVKTTAQSTSAEKTEDTTKVVVEIFLHRLTNNICTGQMLMLSDIKLKGNSMGDSVIK